MRGYVKELKRWSATKHTFTICYNGILHQRAGRKLIYPDFCRIYPDNHQASACPLLLSFPPFLSLLHLWAFPTRNQIKYLFVSLPLWCNVNILDPRVFLALLMASLTALCAVAQVIFVCLGNLLGLPKKKE